VGTHFVWFKEFGRHDESTVLKLLTFEKVEKLKNLEMTTISKHFFFFQNSILSAFRQVIAVVPASVETILSVFYFSRVKLIAVQ